jgi:hypothetical protein
VSDDPQRPDRGREDFHDPAARFAGAPPARSALTLRLILAGIAVLVGVAAAIVVAVTGGSAVALGLLAAFAAVSAADLAVVALRKARGEPG